MLRAEHLDVVARRQRRARRVRPGVRLVPPGALHEADALDGPPHAGVAGHPQEPAVRVGERDEEPLGERGVEQQPAHDGQRVPQRVLGPVGAQVGVGQRDGRGRPLGVDAAAQAAPPGVGDEVADARDRPGAEEPFVGGVQGAAAREGARVGAEQVRFLARHGHPLDVVVAGSVWRARRRGARVRGPGQPPSRPSAIATRRTYTPHSPRLVRTVWACTQPNASGHRRR